MEEYRNFINGEWVGAAGEKMAENINPADTREVIGRARLSTAEDVERAVEAAAAALPAWRDTPPPVRGNIVARAAAIMDERKEELARVLCLEEGKILKEALGEVQKTINVVDFLAQEGRRLNGETIPSEMPSTFCYTIKQPLGVVAAITPWNFPLAIPGWKVAPALVAGNTVVLKPATFTPGCAVEMVRAFNDAGLPPGVLNLVIGSGGVVGQVLVEHPQIKAITFTGSNEVGCRLYADGAARMKKVQCEMGGKNPVVVLEDADLDLAVEGTVAGAFGSTGQRCTATSRAILVDEIADAFVEKVVSRAKEMKVGPGLEEGIDMGPSVDRTQMETVLSYIKVGREEGAELLCGGERLESGRLAHGFFVAPTVFDRVKPTMRIAREEIFGPVLSVIRVRDFKEALSVANDVEFGLSSSIYTQDSARTFRFIEGIETGITHVNSPTMGGEAQAPFGGIKATGVGHREQGRVALDFFTELKTVYLDYTGRKRETNVY